MKKKPVPLSVILEKKNNPVVKNKDDMEERLLAQVNHNISSAESSHSLFISTSNINNQYYHGLLPLPTQNNGNTRPSNTYVDRSAAKSVRAGMSALSDRFLAGNQLSAMIRSRDSQLDELIDHNVQRIFRKMKGQQKVRTQLQTTLIDGNSFSMAFLETSTERDKRKLEDYVEAQEFLSTLPEGWKVDFPKNFSTDKSGSYKGFEWKEVDVKDKAEGEPNPLFFNGTVPLIKHETIPRYEIIEPNDIWFDTSYGDDFELCRHITRRIKTTVGDAEKLGYDPEKLANASENRVDDRLLPENYFRVDYLNPQAMASGRLDHDTSIDPKERKIDLYETFTYSSIPNKESETRIYQIVHDKNSIYSHKEIKRMPFICAKCENVSGDFFARSLVDDAKQFQDINSHAHRLMLENAEGTTWGRYVAIKGQYDRQSLQNNRPGAVIEQMAAGAVDRFENKDISPGFLEAQRTIKDEAEQVLAQPITFTNADGGTPQVATATAFLSVHQETQKGMILTKSLEDTLIEPLYKNIYFWFVDGDLPLEDFTGNPVQGVTLPNVFSVEVDTDTTHDKVAQSMALNDIAIMLSQTAQVDPSVITPQNKFEWVKVKCELSGLDINRIATDPSQNVDPHAAQEQAEMMAIQSEANKVALQHAIIKMRKDAAETAKTETETEELIRTNHSNRLKDQADSSAKLQKIISDAQIKTEANQVKAAEVNVKNKAVNYETILAANKHATDITAPNVNGVR